MGLTYEAIISETPEVTQWEHNWDSNHIIEFFFRVDAPLVIQTLFRPQGATAIDAPVPVNGNGPEQILHATISGWMFEALHLKRPVRPSSSQQ